MLRPALVSLVTLLVFVAGCPAPPPEPPPAPTATATAPPPPAPPLVTAPTIWMTPDQVAGECGQHLATAAKLRDELRAGVTGAVDAPLHKMHDVLIEVDRVLMFVLPVLAYVAFILARRGIDKDLALIRSMDRLR